jgi:hypothetical protein
MITLSALRLSSASPSASRTTLSAAQSSLERTPQVRDAGLARAAAPSISLVPAAQAQASPAAAAALDAQVDRAQHLAPRLASRDVAERAPARNPFLHLVTDEARLTGPTIRFLRPDLADPAAMAKHAGAGKVDAGGQLFVHGASPDDVQQGQIADCYLMSSLASIAHTDPQALHDAIQDHGNGTYTVRFFDEAGHPSYVDVDSQLYGDTTLGGFSALYGRSTTQGELWPAIMEKAYAEWKGGYEAIGQGGSAPDVIRAVTGKTSTVTPTQGTSTDALWSTLQSGDRAGVPMVASTYGDGKKKYDDSGVYGSHVYTILGTEERDGQRYVVLRNPWARAEYANAGYQTDVDKNRDGRLDGDDGTFRMRVEDFAKYYRDVVVSH